MKKPADRAAGFIKSGELCAVVADGLDRTAFFGFFAASFFFWRFGLFKDVRISAVLVPFEIIGRSFATEITVDALIVHVIFARSVFRIFICYISHKEYRVWFAL